METKSQCEPRIINNTVRNYFKMWSNKYHPNRIRKINSQDLWHTVHEDWEEKQHILMSEFRSIKVLTTNYYHTNMFIFNHLMWFLFFPNKINQFVKFEREKNKTNEQARADYFTLNCTSYIHGKCHDSILY